MDSLVGTVVWVLFGFLGAGTLWLFHRGKIPFSKILEEKEVLSEIVGFLILAGTLSVIYFSQK